DGSFAIVVHGGAPLTLKVEAPGYLPSTRRTVPPWRDYKNLEDVEMVRPATLIDTMVHSGSGAVTTVEAPPSTDESGIRAAKVSIPSGTFAQLPDGSILGHFRLGVTEFTIGDHRLTAMPAALPPNSGYTYAVDISAEGAEGQSLKFVDSAGAPRNIN